ncbi:Alpha/Beta hydrolase protein [Kalaharituber pfeilii]|nr:Alpha/Beta hydrolase protein [Kalaharituber pfeilii]
MSRLPSKDDFPSNITPLINIISPQVSKLVSPPPANILLLFHGLGDKAEPFINLAKVIGLPETACIVVQAPTPLPFGLDGFHWGDDLNFSPSGELDPDAGFTMSLDVIHKIVEETLVTKLNYPRRAIFFFGFGQGAMLALEFAARLRPKTPEEGNEYGGVVSIGGPLPYTAPSQTVHTPVLLIGSEKGSTVTAESEKRVKNVFKDVRVVSWKGRNKDGMMQNKEEMADIYKFLSRRLRSWAGTGGPGSGVVEVGGSQ